jgi:hypothetical protein
VLVQKGCGLRARADDAEVFAAAAAVERCAAPRRRRRLWAANPRTLVRSRHNHTTAVG